MTEKVSDDWRPQYTDALLEKIGRLRQEDILCDVTLTVEEQRFRAHRVILAASSEFFRVLFTDDMRKKDSDSVYTLQCVRVTTMGSLLCFMYTGRVQITTENAKDLVIAADFLIIPNLKTIGETFLTESLTPTNTIDLLHFAERYNCDILQGESKKYISERFIRISRADSFKSLNYVVLSEVISQANTKVSKYELILQAVLTWAECAFGRRKTHLEELMQKLPLKSISTYFLHQCINGNAIQQSDICKEILLQALEDNKDGIICCGGHSRFMTTDENFCFVPADNRWEPLTRMRTPHWQHAVVVCRNRLYAIGNSQTGTCDIACEAYDPELNAWTPTASMPHHLRLSSVTTLNGLIFTTGGDDINGRTGRVSCYDPHFDKWHDLASLNCARAQHSSVSLNGFIYVFGGCDDAEVLRSVEQYDADQDRWCEIPSMMTPRYLGCASAMNDKAFVIGGYQTVRFSSSTLSSCEVYDPDVNSWFTARDLCVPRGVAAAAAVGDKLYVFGGRDSLGYLETFECYCEKDGRWRIMGEMPFGKRAWIGSGALSLPRN